MKILSVAWVYLAASGDDRGPGLRIWIFLPIWIDVFQCFPRHYVSGIVTDPIQAFYRTYNKENKWKNVPQIEMVIEYCCLEEKIINIHQKKS